MNTSEIQLIAFFVATTVSIVGSHIGLIRLVGNASDKPIEAIARETSGVLIVVQFALVILLGAPAPIVVTMFKTSAQDYFDGPSLVIPAAILALVGFDMILAHKRTNRTTTAYYYTVALIALIVSIVLIIDNLAGLASYKALFFASLALALLVIVAQFFKSSLRLAGYVK
jgi:hypothetical protein